MKKLIVSSSILLMLFSSGRTTAQTVVSLPQTQKEKEVELRRIDAFNGANVQTIPYASGFDLTDYTDLAKKMDCSVKLQPLSTNAILQKNYRDAKNNKNSTADLKVDAVLEQAYWGTLVSAEDNKNLVFTVEYEASHVANGTLGFYSKGATFTLFNDSLKPVKDFYLRTSDTTYSISIMPQFSTSYFNSDSKMEFMIHAHSFAAGISGPASCRDTLFIINEDGEILKSIGKTSGASLHEAPVSSYSTEKRISIIDAYYSDLADTMYTYIYKSRDIVKDEFQPIFTFRIPANVTSYSNGPLGVFEKIEGTGYYITSQYEKPFIANQDMYNPIVEMNNKYNIFLYDINFDLVKTISLPLIGIEDNEYSMSTLLYFDDYIISKNIFNSDDKFEIVYGMSRYYANCDCEKLEFYLMDEDGNIIEEMVNGVVSVIKLQAIPGQSDEYALLIGGGDMVEAITMYSMPAMKENVTFKALHENELLSVNFERVPNVNGSYEYVFGLGKGESADNTVYGGICYYDLEGKSVKRIRIDLGPNAMMFQPIISSMTMNPYFFMPDNQQEYLYFFRYLNPSGTLGGGFGIANETGNLYTWNDNSTDGTFQGAGLRANEDQTVMKNLYITFNKDGKTKHTFYKLPLQDVVLDGEGTAESPYIITTPAELDQVRNYPDAHFILGNDIDMAAFTGVGQKGFVGIPDFRGNFDGKNHYIKNLTLAGNGLFEQISGDGIVANLSLRNVIFTEPDLQMAGTIVSYLPGGKIRNCHVETNIETASGKGTLGGLVGQAPVQASIDRCSFSGNIIAPNMDEVGGIAGRLMTGTVISNSMAKGTIKAAETAGGIAGYTMNDATIINSYSSVDVYTNYTAGGIVGNNRAGRILRTYSSGNIAVGENDSPFNKGVAGGIAGETQIGMSGGHIKYSFALNDTILAPESYARIAYTEMYNDWQGFSAMDSNYALASMLTGPEGSLATVNDTNCKENRMHGESGSLETFNQTFYENVGWAFGSDSLNPWQMSGNKPRLWYEFNVRGVELSLVKTTLKKDSSLTLQATVMPEDATNTKVLWSSSDTKIASVNQSGVVKGIGAGTATITAKTAEGGFTASCEITVVIPVEKVIFDKKEITIAPLTPVTLSTTVLPENASNKNVLYYSLNPEIVTAGGNVIYASTTGTARIAAISEDGGASDTCTVYVIIPVEDLYLNETNITLNRENPTFQLEAEVYPEDATDRALVWKSLDENIATVDDNGLVSAHRKGQTEVIVSTEDETVSTACIVTVTEDVANESGIRNQVSVRLTNGNILITAHSGIESAAVYGISGQCIVHLTDIHSDQVSIPAGKLPQGIYLLKTTLSNGSTVISKIIK